MARLYLTGIKDTVDFGFLCNKYLIIMQIFSLIALSSFSDASLDGSNKEKIDQVKYNNSEFFETNQNNQIITNNSTESIQFLSTKLDQITCPLIYAQNINKTDKNIGKNSTENTQRIEFNDNSTATSDIKPIKTDNDTTSLQSLQEKIQVSNSTENVTIRSKKKKTNIKKFKKISKLLNRKKSSRRRENRKLGKLFTKKIKINTLSDEFENNTSFSNISNVNNSLNYDNSSDSLDNCTLSLGKKLNDYVYESKYPSSYPCYTKNYNIYSIINKYKTNSTIIGRQKREENSEQVDNDNNLPEETEFYDIDADFDLDSEPNVITGVQNNESNTSSISPLKKGGKRRKKPKILKNQSKQNLSKIVNNIATNSYNNQHYSSKADIMKREEIDENTALLYLMKSLLDNDVIENADEVLPNDYKNSKNSSILQFFNNNLQNDWEHPSKKETGTHSTDKVTYPFHFNIYFYNNQEDECSTESPNELSYPIITASRLPNLIHNQDDQGGSEKKGMYRESFMDYGRASSGDSSVSCPGGCNMGSVVFAVLGVFLGTAVLALLAYKVLWKFLKKKICCNSCEAEPSST